MVGVAYSRGRTNSTSVVRPMLLVGIWLNVLKNYNYGPRLRIMTTPHNFQILRYWYHVVVRYIHSIATVKSESR